MPSQFDTLNQQRNNWGSRSYRGATPLGIIPTTSNTIRCWRFGFLCLGLHQEVLFRLGWMRLKEKQQQVQVCSRLVFWTLLGSYLHFSVINESYKVPRMASRTTSKQENIYTVIINLEPQTTSFEWMFGKNTHV